MTYSPEYYKTVARMDGTAADRLILAYLGGMVLDVGCGLGRFPSNVGVDSERFPLLSQKEKMVVQASAEYLPFRGDSFDTLLCNHVIEHLERPELAMEEFARVAHTLVLSYPNKDYFLFRLRIRRQNNTHRHEFGKDFSSPSWLLSTQRTFRLGYNVVSVLVRKPQ